MEFCKGFFSSLVFCVTIADIYIAFAELTEIITSPSPEFAILFNCYCVTPPGRDCFPVCICSYLFRDVVDWVVSGIYCAFAELTEIITSPSPELAILLNCCCVIASCRDYFPWTRLYYLTRIATVCCCAVAKLTANPLNDVIFYVSYPKNGLKKFCIFRYLI